MYRGNEGTIVGPDELLNGGDVLPGFALRLRDVLDELAAAQTAEEQPRSE